MKYKIVERRVPRWRTVMAEFQVVSKSKRRRDRSSKGNRPNPERCNDFPDNVDLNDLPSVESLVQKIDSCRYEIEQSQFFIDVKGLFKDGAQNELGDPRLKALNKGGFKDIVCYGVGRLHSCPTARYQFALMLLLKDLLQITGLCYIYEPCFSQQDKDVVTRFGCTLIAENEEGKRTVEQKTLFFMLHCGKPLYNNLLWSNWEPQHLVNMVILGNSFSSYLERLPMRRFREEAAYIALILPHVVEVPMPNTFRYLDIFNDSSFHYFPSKSLQDLPDDTWRHRPEPHYDENDPEIIQVSRTATKH